ncbi:hypothetical protein [Lichenifustis flavocetrariae]|uniref:Uncharacterized protein n=1 Tax=Lichenifustis flavocetrariae TaxID=2949735 RepID=A0AA41Z6M3_9HYPH|nr:hypothetical protein [Lichenifustis flavocetrariae]MCW6511468.1 hypothetical protein [Lichenifustis flavocetrariae]
MHEPQQQAASLGQEEVSNWVGLSRFMEQHLHGTDDMARLTLYGCISAGLKMKLQLGSHAAIGRDGKGYAIAVDPGTTIQLNYVLTRLCAHPDALAKFRSKPGSLARFRGKLGPRLTGSLSLPRLMNGRVELLFGGSPEAPSLPPDPKLRHHLGGIVLFTLQFMFLHELAHVTSGHVERSAQLRRESHALPRAQREVFLREHLEPLEHLADSISMLHLGALINVYAAGARRQPDPTIRGDVLDWLRLAGFGLGALFLLLETFDGEGGYHPTADTRAIFLRAYATTPKTMPPGFEHVSFDEGTDALELGYRDAIAAWDALGWQRNKATWSTMLGEQLLAKVERAQAQVTPPPCAVFPSPPLTRARP